MRQSPASWIWISAAALACSGPAQAQVRADGGSTLDPGAAASDCRSALHVGLARCGASHSLTDNAAPGPSRQGRLISEAQVDAYLQQFGKPPREAVRALLDPSDENILAWLRARRRTLDNARYVAERMSALEPVAAASDTGNVAHGGVR